MNREEIQNQKNIKYEERHALAVDRIRRIVSENNIPSPYLSYFQDVAVFMSKLEEVRQLVRNGLMETLGTEELSRINNELYRDIVKDNYEKSFASPAYSSARFGREMGQLLSVLYTEIRAGIPWAFENREDYLTILYELFIEVYTSFESACTESGESAEERKIPEVKEIREILYWYVSDYCDVFLADRILDQIDPENSFAVDLICSADLDQDDYLYRFGEYITENELGTAEYLRKLPEETLQKMADVFTDGYRRGFINTGKDLSRKSVVNIRYSLGFEKVIRLAISNFRKMGLEPVIYRAASSVITKREHHKIGYYGAVPNWQYEYDHRQDQAAFMDKRYIERRLEVMKTVYEKNRQKALQFAGPAVMETFGEDPFSPEVVPEALSYNEEQKKLALMYDSRAGQLTNEYIPGDERSFTIIAYPVPAIGNRYPEIFDEVVRINTLDAQLYENLQQIMIDALDQGEYVRVTGKGNNRTDMKIMLHPLSDPAKETKFENCVADVNIPVGEVFTSPVLEGTSGVLHVGSVYLEGLQYLDLELVFENGCIKEYGCGNFADPEAGKKYISDNILKGHPTLPLGEFAVGTNTTAYVTAKKYGIESKMPILIAEKTGPHFAVGDTCYSWSEDIRVYNPNGKEIIAKDNSISLKRKEDISAAYFNCHTDITIPYEELEEISVVTKDGKHIILLKDGKFVLPGTEILNRPFESL